MQGIPLFVLYLLVMALFMLIWRWLVSPPWWVKVITQSPSCTYYFGPFDSPQQAQGHQNDYLEDIKQEGAKGITWTIEKGRPAELTIFQE